MEKIMCLLVGLLVSLWSCEAYKLLAIFPVPSPSHGILGDSMVKHLLDAGHEVTYITPYIKKLAPHPKLHIIDVSDNSKAFDESLLNVKDILDGTLNLQDHDMIFELLINISEATLSNPNVQNLLRKPPQSFDAIIGEYMFTDIYSVFPAALQSPYIWFLTIEPHSMILRLIDGPLNPAYNSDYMNGRIAPYSFTERAHELWSITLQLVKQKFFYDKKEEELYQKYVVPIIKEQGRPVPPYDELKYNASLLLGNSHVAIGDAIPLPPNYILIGGYHIDDEVKPLPENLQKILDNAKNGVIFFSLGSNMKSKDLPNDLKRGLLNVFGGLKQTVIWKFEENLPDLPNNVHIVQWAPQQSILAHPNLVLFITHGGLLSVTEAIHFGKPLICIPGFADQFINSNRVQQKGYGIKVDLTYSLPKDLKTALDKVLANPKYAEKAKELSVAYHDRPMKPKEALNFWVQHVVRTRGAPHLRSIALHLPLYQRMYLDLLAVGILATIVLLAVLKKILSSGTTKTVKEKRH